MDSDRKKAIGDVLPMALFGLLAIYRLKSIDLFSGMHVIPEGLPILLIMALHPKWRNMLPSIAAGTVCHMLLVQFAFV